MTAYATEFTAMDWGIDSPSTTIFDFDYTDGRDQLLRLYDKGTRRQWIGSDRIDWSLEVDPTNPLGHARRGHPALRHAVVGEDERRARRARCAATSRRGSSRQFLHGEQGALICTAKIVQTVPDIDSQVLRRHAGDRRGPPRRGVQPLPAREARARLPAQPQPASRCSTTCISRQPLGHDLPRHAGAHRGARAGRVRPDPQHGDRPARQGDQRLRDAGRGPPRHVRPAGAARLLPAAHRRPSATSARSSASTRCYRMRDRFLGEEVWERLGLPVDEVAEYVEHSELQQHVPRLPVHAHRADPQGHRPVGAARSRRRSRTWA